MKNKLIKTLALSLFLSACTGEEISSQDVRTNSTASTTKTIKAYIKDVKSVDNQIQIDEITWLSMAEETCRDETDQNSDLEKCNPNGFLITNPEEEIETINLNENTNITLIDLENGTVSSKEVNFEELTSTFEENLDYYKYSPFEIKYQEDEALEIKEIYVP